MKVGEPPAPCFCLCKQSLTKTALTVSVLLSLRNYLVWWQHGGAVEELLPLSEMVACSNPDLGPF